MKRIFLINGPPGSGKDEVGNIMRSLHGDCRIEKFAFPIKRGVSAAWGLSSAEYQYYFETSAKEVAQERFFGKTPREVLISFSEDWLKHFYDPYVFGRLLRDRIDRHEECVIAVTDSGFREEAVILVDWFPGQVTLIKVIREGCDFTGDSRGYIQLPVTTHTIYNNGTINDLREKVIPILHT